MQGGKNRKEFCKIRQCPCKTGEGGEKLFHRFFTESTTFHSKPTGFFHSSAPKMPPAGGTVPVTDPIPFAAAVTVPVTVSLPAPVEITVLFSFALTVT